MGCYKVERGFLSPAVTGGLPPVQTPCEPARPELRSPGWHQVQRMPGRDLDDCWGLWSHSQTLASPQVLPGCGLCCSRPISKPGGLPVCLQDSPRPLQCGWRRVVLGLRGCGADSSCAAALRRRGSGSAQPGSARTPSLALALPPLPQTKDVLGHFTGVPTPVISHGWALPGLPSKHAPAWPRAAG